MSSKSPKEQYRYPDHEGLQLCDPMDGFATSPPHIMQRPEPPRRPERPLGLTLDTSSAVRTPYTIGVSAFSVTPTRTLSTNPPRDGLRFGRPGASSYGGSYAKEKDLGRQKTFDQRSLNDNERDMRRFGMRRSTFWLSIALLLLMLVAIIGGGLGGHIAIAAIGDAKMSCQVEKASKAGVADSATATSTGASASRTAAGLTTLAEATAAPIVVPTTGILTLNCPALNGTTYSTMNPQQPKRINFSVACGTDYYPTGGRTPDIMAVVTYTFETCMNACVAYNGQKPLAPCVGVVFNPNLADVQFKFGTCFLKNSTATAAPGLGNSFASAKIIPD